MFDLEYSNLPYFNSIKVRLKLHDDATFDLSTT